jgi:hypothetical protein
VLEHGLIDAIVPRRDLRHTLTRLLHLYAPSTIVRPKSDDGKNNSSVDAQLPVTKYAGKNDGIRPGI